MGRVWLVVQERGLPMRVCQTHSAKAPVPLADSAQRQGRRHHSVMGRAVPAIGVMRGLPALLPTSVPPGGGVGTAVGTAAAPASVRLATHVLLALRHRGNGSVVVPHSTVPRARHPLFRLAKGGCGALWNQHIDDAA